MSSSSGFSSPNEGGLAAFVLLNPKLAALAFVPLWPGAATYYCKSHK